MRAFLILGCGLLAAACGAGCGSHDHVRLGTRVDRLPPAPVKPAPRLAPPLRELDVVLATPTAYIAPGEALATAAALGAALRRTGAFTEVRIGDPEAPARVRLEIAPARIVVDDEPNEDWIGAVTGYLFLGFWSNWFHEQRCFVEATFAATLRDTATGRALGHFPSMRGRAIADLSFWERRGGVGPTLATICWFPPMGFDSDTEKVTALLLPHSMDRPARTLVESLAAVPAREVDTLSLKARKIAGLAIELLPPADGRPPGVRISGEAAPLVRRVWIADELVHEAPADETSPAPPTLDARVKKAIRFGPAGSAVVVVEVTGAAPAPAAEIRSERSWRLGRSWPVR